MSDSPVIQLLEIVWRNASALRPGWLSLNQGMYGALRIAIESGFRFERDDLIEVGRRFRSGYWIGEGGAESLYIVACDKNTSAAIAMEKMFPRKPFIIDGKRLSVGSEAWHPKHGRLWVTSFLSPETIGMCWYDNDGNLRVGKPAKRFSFDHKTFKKEGFWTR